MTTPPPSPATRLCRFITGLYNLLGRQLPHEADPLPGFLLGQWLRRLVRRLDALVARPPPPPPFACPPPIPRCPPGLAFPPAARAPRRRGWLRDLSPDFAGQGEALRRLLTDREVQALLQAAPRLQAAFRRLRHLLGIDPPAAPRHAAPAAIRPAQPDTKPRHGPAEYANPPVQVTAFANPA